MVGIDAQLSGFYMDNGVFMNKSVKVLPDSDEFARQDLKLLYPLSTVPRFYC